MLCAFVRIFPSIYGKHKVSYNIHGLLHIAQCVSQFGPVDSFSAYRFENHMQKIKKMIRKPSQLLQQLANRCSENEILNTNNVDQNQNLPFTGSSRSYKFDNFVLKLTEADKCCSINGDTPILISEFVRQEGKTAIIGRRFVDPQPYFKTPIDSKGVLGIVECQKLNSQNEVFPVEAVSFKYMKLFFDNKYILIPLLHERGIFKLIRNQNYNFFIYILNFRSNMIAEKASELHFLAEYDAGDPGKQ